MRAVAGGDEKVRFVAVFPVSQVTADCFAGIGGRSESSCSSGGGIRAQVEAMTVFCSFGHGLVGLKEGRADCDDGRIIAGDIWTNYTKKTSLLGCIEDGNISGFCVNMYLNDPVTMASYCVLPPTRAIGKEPCRLPILFKRLYENLFGYERLP